MKRLSREKPIRFVLVGTAFVKTCGGKSFILRSAKPLSDQRISRSETWMLSDPRISDLKSKNGAAQTNNNMARLSRLWQARDRQATEIVY
jgi:hypothetical protein